MQKTLKKAPTLLTLTEKAVSQLKTLQSKNKKNGFGLRIEVMAGGCAGFKYFMDFEEKADKDDIIIKEDGFTLHVHPTSAEFLKGTTLDYVESLESSGFSFQNPNVTHTCHCGKSVC